ncbi:MAG TPA: IS66 family insertion sequence element accessory protein TnpB [Candidatus Mediterraneibacter intestinigallinarum]|nr:IS66 family insertion sequence element accessory protein TnpB [Candidatus Mediterraneibacter intestinigallinarum]
MDKITHQVRAEHWTRILNECMNSGMSKTAWCRANGISEKQFFYWQRILRREAYEASQNSPLPVVAETESLSAVQRTVSFAEIKLPAVSPDASPVFRPDLVIRKENLVLEISNSASSELLSRVGGILHAE